MAVLITLAGLLAGCGSESPQAGTRQAAPVSVATVEQKSMPLEIRVIGAAEAYSTVTVKPQVGGQLVEVTFREGDDVQRGQVLFRVNPRPFEEALKQAEASLARNEAQKKQAEAALVRDQAQAKNAQADARRYGSLHEQGIIAQELYDRMRTNAEALEAAVDANRAAIENAEAAMRADRAAIDIARIQLGYCTIRSPLDGRAGRLLVHNGNVVKVNESELVVINQIAPIHVSFAVPEQHLGQIKSYMARAPLSVRASPAEAADSVESGALSFIDNAVDRATGTIGLKARFANAGRRLWPGQFVNVVLTLATEQNAVVIPKKAVQTGQTGEFVYVVKSDMTAESRPVVLTRTVQDEAIVASGLKPGEKVVTDGQMRLAPGAPVEIKPAGGNGNQQGARS